MSATPSHPASRPSTLTEDSRTLIQMLTEEWCGVYGPRLSGDSLSILRSGINLIWTLVDNNISPGAVRDATLDHLGEGDGNVDLIELASKLTKRMVADVCAELRADLPSS